MLCTHIFDPTQKHMACLHSARRPRILRARWRCLSRSALCFFCRPGLTSVNQDDVPSHARARVCKCTHRPNVGVTKTTMVHGAKMLLCRGPVSGGHSCSSPPPPPFLPVIFMILARISPHISTAFFLFQAAKTREHSPTHSSIAFFRTHTTFNTSIKY